ncbi:MAG: 1-deoxy-D-xylulose 5-phosphate reductoisomerase [candidate division Zixibacteria bacterium DG_27]|nr:MAG: 1-deoxy-D-xylulose 5-phosphate reductoisomerase [candidate division Zixibacteria bacterium DG_27]
MKRIVILGSTGSIGTSALEVIRVFPREFEVVGLSCHENVGLLRKQIALFKPEAVCITEPQSYRQFLSQTTKTGVKVLSGEEGLSLLAAWENVDIVLNGLVGAVGLKPTLAAIELGRRIALANKETLVMAGDLINQSARARGAEVLPVDSEHSAIWQCLRTGGKKEIKSLIITASGGPFHGQPELNLEKVSRKEALAHPTWYMGRKISVDSATLMNKGLEVIEAHWLFGVPPEKIRVVIHPQSIVHSLVEFVDNSVMAQMSLPDMKLPISYALFYPERKPLSDDSFNLTKIAALSFLEPDFRRFPCLNLAYEALRSGGTAPAVLNAANEVAVFGFLEEKVKFTRIPEVIREVLSKHQVKSSPQVEEIFEADAWARGRAEALLEQKSR